MACNLSTGFKFYICCICKNNYTTCSVSHTCIECAIKARDEKIDFILKI